MPCDRPSPILVDVAPRDLPSTFRLSAHEAPPVCQMGISFVDELYRDHRLSSVEWKVLRDAIWPLDRRTGLAVLQVKPGAE